MTRPNWLSAFPMQPAKEAVAALRQGWMTLAARPRPDFNSSTKEGALTKRLKIYVENHVSRERGLLGMWAAENVIGEIDQNTGKLVEERRTDIVYGWNDEHHDLKLVFEFKRLGRQKRDRNHYLGEHGLARFVTGIYSRKQAIAIMVGVLLAPKEDVVPQIISTLEKADVAAALRLQSTGDGHFYTRPSAMFAHAEFDTEHKRDARLAPTHGAICVSHFFFSFGYPVGS